MTLEEMTAWVWSCGSSSREVDCGNTAIVSPCSTSGYMRGPFTRVLKGMIGMSRLRWPVGLAGRDIDAVARAVIDDAGYGPRFGHGLGHGIGLDVHESPRLSRQSTETLEPGMVVTVEPGVYIPGLGGVRIEDDVLVTDSGAKNLCSLPKTIEWATR